MTPDELERKCRQATPGLLNVWVHDSRREISVAALREIRRRAREAREAHSLTGVVNPVDRT